MKRTRSLSLQVRSSKIRMVPGRQIVSVDITRVQDLQMDLFATEYNHKLKCYVASNLDPQEFTIDALSLNWNQ